MVTNEKEQELLRLIDENKKQLEELRAKLAKELNQCIQDKYINKFFKDVAINRYIYVKRVFKASYNVVQLEGVGYRFDDRFGTLVIDYDMDVITVVEGDDNDLMEITENDFYDSLDDAIDVAKLTMRERINGIVENNKSK